MSKKATESGGTMFASGPRAPTKLGDKFWKTKQDNGTVTYVQGSTSKRACGWPWSSRQCRCVLYFLTLNSICHCHTSLSWLLLVNPALHSPGALWIFQCSQIEQRINGSDIVVSFRFCEA